MARPFDRDADELPSEERTVIDARVLGDELSTPLADTAKRSSLDERDTSKQGGEAPLRADGKRTRSLGPTELGPTFGAKRAGRQLAVLSRDPSTLGDAFAEELDEEESSAVDALGPAFPDEEPTGQDDPVHEPERVGAEESPVPQSLADIVGSIAGSVAAGGRAREGTEAAFASSSVDDAWASLDEQPGNWRHQSGERKAAARSRAAPGLAREETNVEEEVGSSERGGARLVCIGGADEGAEFALLGETVIGRAPSCDVVLKESSASREHARLRREASGWVLVDNGSNNGTFVNSERISKTRVASGDELGFGKARFRLLEVGDVFKPLDTAGRPVLPGAAGVARSQYLMPAAVSGAIALVTLVVVVAIVQSRRGASEPTAAETYLASGLEAIKNRDWKTAEAQLAIYRSLRPDEEQAKALLATVEQEHEGERKLLAARQAWEARDLARAYALASAITFSSYRQDASEIVRGIDAELDAGLARARAAAAAGRTGEALSLLAPVRAVRPTHPEVLSLSARLARAHRGRTTEPQRVEGRPAVIPVPAK